MVYPIQNHTRVCAATGRALAPGERVYSVICDEAGQLLRRDFAANAWRGPPDGAIAFWCGKVPQPEKPNRLPIDDDLLMECFNRLSADNDPARIRFRYVVGLLLLRRKRLKFEDSHRDGDVEILRLRCPRTGEVVELIDPRLTEAEMTEVQDEVFHLLGWD
jgi:hypothetical protein